MRNKRSRMRRIATAAAGGMALQFGGCDLGQITTTQTVTLDARDVVVSIVRAAILGPIESFLTAAIDDVFGVGDE